MSEDTKTPGNGVHLLGELTAVEQEGLRSLRNSSDELIRRIGLNRVEEARMLAQLNLIERKASSSLQEIGKRLSIPDGAAWSVTADGRAIAVPMPSQAGEGG